MHRCLLAGDLNDTPDSRVLQEFGKEWARANADALPTIPVMEPQHQIDYVLIRPVDRWQCSNCCGGPREAKRQ